MTQGKPREREEPPANTSVFSQTVPQTWLQVLGSRFAAMETSREICRLDNTVKNYKPKSDLEKCYY